MSAETSDADQLGDLLGGLSHHKPLPCSEADGGRDHGSWIMDQGLRSMIGMFLRFTEDGIIIPTLL